MKELLKREPKPAIQVITDLLKEDPNYTWHQTMLIGFSIGRVVDSLYSVAMQEVGMFE
jgi:hypothetical protein